MLKIQIMHFKRYHIMSAMLVTLLCAACGNVAPDSPERLSVPQPNQLEKIYIETKDGGDSVRNMIYGIMQELDFGKGMNYARQIYALGQKYDDDKTASVGASYMGMSHTYFRNADSALIYLTRAVELAEKRRFDSGLYTAYNGMGFYIMNFHELDYYRALDWFKKGLDAAKRSGDKVTYSVILANIAQTYCLKNDSEGLPYALECYEYGAETGNDYLIFIGAQAMSLIYLLESDHANALKYVNIAEEAIGKEGDTAFSPYKAILIYTLHGRILTAMGDYSGAKRYLDSALSFGSDNMGGNLVLTYLYYGDYYKQSGGYRRALDMYMTGLTLAEELYQNMFYRKISETYQAMGDYAMAMQYYQEFHALSQKQFDAEKERSLNEMKVQYDIEKKETEIAMSKLQLSQERRKVLIMWAVVLIVMAALVATFYVFRRRNKLYLDIVKQSQKAVRAKEQLREMPQQIVTVEGGYSAEENEVGKYANSTLSIKRSAMLIMQLEHVMETERLYRDNELTVDKLSEKVGSNRSYLSRIINEHFGLNFNSYINKYRIEEAVQILSDVDNDVPLKVLAFELGFNNLPSFYNSFQKEIGIPPSQYRKKVIELSK